MHVIDHLFADHILDHMWSSPRPEAIPTLYVYTNIMRRLGQNGDLVSMDHFFRRMQREGIKPDGVLYGALIHCCLDRANVTQVHVHCVLVYGARI